jgi:hypothetical protein
MSATTTIKSFSWYAIKFRDTLHSRIHNPTDKIYGSRKHLESLHELALNQKKDYGIILTKYCFFYYDVMMN